MTNLHVTAPSGPEAAECLVCSELALLVLFSPCQHRTVCEGECRGLGLGLGLGRGGAGRGCGDWVGGPRSAVRSPAECARRMKKCIRCQAVIGKKLRPGGVEERVRGMID